MTISTHALADELHEFIAAAPHEYPGHLVELFERCEAAMRVPNQQVEADKSADNCSCSPRYQSDCAYMKGGYCIDPSPPSPQETRRALDVREAMLEAGAKALADDVWHPPQPLKSLSSSDRNKFTRQALLVLKAALSTSPAPAEDVWRSPATWRAPIKTVADLVSNLLTLDQSMEIHGAYHANNQARARGLSLSRERVTNGTIRVGDESVPYSLIIWSGPPAEDVRASVIEECAKVVEQHQERITETDNGSERSLSPRMVGNQMGLAYVNGIRSLTIPDPKQSIGDR